ncbi:hypothetical protein [Anaeromusa acidaminophila]|uniref:hypothetical protein n=1 Tax=Anaeromusa acidaminophila TaxID=81464 RepID=UPI0008FBD632|nr:hypothetical protein [Anaeromusa acidaminophila]
MFLRGYGSQTYSQVNGTLNGVTVTNYSSNTLGTIQGDAIRNITGSVTSTGASGPLWTGTTGDIIGTGSLVANKKMGGDIEGWVVTGWTGGFSLNASLSVPTANENRPINKAVKWIIKAR